MVMRSIALAIGLAALLAFPWLAEATGYDFYTGVVIRIMIFAVAATSLNLILGYGGMVSFGHAAFLGLGAYTAGIAAHHGMDSAWLILVLAVVVAAAAAAVVGSMAIRTRGVYFIMITMAMAQLFYYLFVGLRTYGGDDGLRILSRPGIGLGIDITEEKPFYLLVLVFFVLAHWLVRRLIDSRFGLAMNAIRENDVRVAAVGYPLARYRLAAFVIAGLIAGMAGALLAMHNLFVSPKLLHWTQSGTLLIMVALGGVGYFYGGIVGAVVFLMLEEMLSFSYTYWHIYVGLVLLAIVLVAPGGLCSILSGEAFGRSNAGGNAGNGIDMGAGGTAKAGEAGKDGRPA
jgi:branched-chain amino acid transport system permease protein